MEDYKKTVSVICNHIGDQHPWINAAMAQKHKLSLSNSLMEKFENTVAYGPFKGLKFIEDSHWGAADKGSMILGIYEQEVLNELTTLPKNYNIFVDLGAADGYYCIGVLVNSLFKKSYCYEISENGRDVVLKNAVLNGANDRLIIRGEAKKEVFSDIPESELHNAVVFVDIEGSEFELFDKSVFSLIKKSIILIELHEWLFIDGESRLAKLINDSNDTHTHKIFTMGSRDPSKFKELEKWSDLDRWLLCSEGRAQLMRWIRFDPC